MIFSASSLAPNAKDRSREGEINAQKVRSRVRQRYEKASHHISRYIEELLFIKTSMHRRTIDECDRTDCSACSLFEILREHDMDRGDGGDTIHRRDREEDLLGLTIKRRCLG